MEGTPSAIVCYIYHMFVAGLVAHRALFDWLPRTIVPPLTCLFSASSFGLQYANKIFTEDTKLSMSPAKYYLATCPADLKAAGCKTLTGAIKGCECTPPVSPDIPISLPHFRLYEVVSLHV